MNGSALVKLLGVVVLVAASFFAGMYLYTPEQTVSTNPIFRGGEGAGSLAGSQARQGEIHEVREGQLIQDAVIAAKAGDTILVYPGTYSETVYVDKENITLSGVVEKGKWPELDGKGELNDAILYSGNGFLVENFKIRRFKGNGIMGQSGNNFVIRNNIIHDAGVYGIFPQLGVNGLVVNNVISKIADAAIYVGMSDNIDVIGNQVFDSVAGIEIENSRHSLVEGNYTYNNTGGILAFITPGLPIKTTYDVIIRKNFVLNNNHPNFAAPGSTVSRIPPGTGILVMAADDVVIEDNIISGNDNAGIVVTDLAMAKAAHDPGSEPNPDNLVILNNIMTDNGSNPVGEMKTMNATGIDIVDTGAGSNKCILNASRYNTLLLPPSRYGQCDEAKFATHDINTKTLDKPAPATVYEGATKENWEQRVGKRGYFAICTGCHAYQGVLIGPSVKDIQDKYAPLGAEGIELVSDYIAEPFKIREEFHEMPPQRHLDEDTRLAIAKYILKVSNDPNKKK
ncbi:parallel beta-helix domain-containing protein [Temperatibacter marinus]|uniref:Parallel beta-helix domain-containing protein n=1 Tax=Temperatibacter marinus TaxID=1456591 RepID=A0AA52HA97_9PROT|nr:parallel beta-helix domain-containing protein [Temperatibacter marinus]WND02510.1 parallel beta-helix domain-containing protein [Temperatibacter marinus]